MAAPQVPNKGTPDFPVPSIVVDTIVSEISSRYQQNYAPVEPGTPFVLQNHSKEDVAEFQGTILLNQRAAQGSPEMQERVWASIPATQDVYNHSIGYSDENVAYPIFKRRYLELRDTYAPRADNSTFTGVYALKITNPGSGYTNPVVTITDADSGTGATAIAIIDGTTGAIAKITVKTEGQNYTGPGATISDSNGGTGSGATCAVVVQPIECQMVKEEVVPASGDWVSLYFMVERTYEFLDGPVRTDWIQNPLTQVSSTVERQRLSSLDVITLPVVPELGQNVTFNHISKAVDEIITKQIDPTQMSDFYRVYVGNGPVDIPRLLLALNVVWDSSSAAGSYSEDGTGFSVGTSVSLALTAQGRGQGSAAVLPELVPIWYPLWTNDLPYVEYYFILPKNAPRAEVITQASIIASLWLGTATTILDWPEWAPNEINLSIAGQKTSISAEAVARCSVSIDQAGDVSETLSSGSGTSQDTGHSMRPVNLPLCLCAGIVLQNPIRSSGVTVTASAVVTAGTNFPGESATATIAGVAFGLITPAVIPPTTQTGYPASGIYGKIQASPSEDGYSAYGVRTFDFGSLPHNPQITTVDFFGLTGASFQEIGGTGLGFVLSFNGNTIVLGVWFFISTETQPDFSGFGVTAYLRVTLTTGDSAATIATNTQAAFAGSYSANVTAAVVNGGGTNTAVKLTDTDNGPENLYATNTTDATITLTKLGK